ncbi:MAG: enhanced serine sensitivity protein SseB C-terminal domain-containing protein [bacterium]|nr:enhanced serine sensitivity protein SseB C-terminal domain-containing protein [bacterium]
MQIKLKQDSEVYIGAPKNPLPESVNAQLESVLSQIPEVVEGHLPQMYAPELGGPPRQVLVVVLKEFSDQLMEDISQRVGESFSPHFSIDILPLQIGDQLIADFKSTETEIFSRR